MYSGAVGGRESTAGVLAGLHTFVLVYMRQFVQVARTDGHSQRSDLDDSVLAEVTSVGEISESYLFVGMSRWPCGHGKLIRNRNRRTLKASNGRRVS